MATLECGGFLFYSNFDSGNLARVELVPKNESAVVTVNRNGKDVLEIPDVEFNIWTKPDCMGTEFENGNRTWFYFGMKSTAPGLLVKLNLVDLNRQAKMYSQGMAPVARVVPGRPHWERIRDKPTFTITDNIFTLTFKYKTPENIEAITYFAFTYPYSYNDLQENLETIDARFSKKNNNILPSFDDIYYVRECVCKSLEDRRIDLITISSYYNITNDRETRLKYLFPYDQEERPFKFYNKKVIFVSARVHPGETPSSFVFNGLLNLLLNRDDPCAILLRRMYVFKMIPFLNPDGVVRGHYRTDTRGVNLNRVYLNPILSEHPSVYAARILLRYYHSDLDESVIDPDLSFDNKMTQQVQVLSLDERRDLLKRNSDPWCKKYEDITESGNISKHHTSCTELNNIEQRDGTSSPLFMYIDMHGHASKKGIFMYGNHFDDLEKNIECMLLPKIMSLNNQNFHFTACNFTERNMYLRDRRDGMSREGSGRVAVLKLTGLVRSYTLECNYNSGRLVNILPQPLRDSLQKTTHNLPAPPKYTPHIFEEVGKALGVSILDLTGHHPNSRIPNSEFHSVSGLRDWLRTHCLSELSNTRAPLPRSKLATTQSQTSNASNKQIRSKTLRSLGLRSRPTTSKCTLKKLSSKSCTTTVPVDKKENLVYLAKEQNFVATSSHCSSRVFTRPSSVSRSKTQIQRAKPKRDTNSRGVQTSTTLLQKLKTESESTHLKESPKRIKVSTEKEPNSDRLKLREICFIKENRTKKLIAKFKSTDSEKQTSHDDDEDLVVAWDSDYTPKILSKQTDTSSSSSASTKYPYKSVEPSTSGSTTKQIIRNTYKTNFTSAKTKRPKGSCLRRLTSTSNEMISKIEKLKKRKKIKSKML